MVLHSLEDHPLCIKDKVDVDIDESALRSNRGFNIGTLAVRYTVTTNATLNQSEVISDDRIEQDPRDTKMTQEESTEHKSLKKKPTTVATK